MPKMPKVPKMPKIMAFYLISKWKVQCTLGSESICDGYKEICERT